MGSDGAQAIEQEGVNNELFQRIQTVMPIHECTAVYMSLDREFN